MQSEAQAAGVGLTDVMLAMDVVDTLRHEQQLVAYALNDEAREQALIERVRRAYMAQGIEVSEAMIVEGVASLKARQYVYEPPPQGLRTALLRGWVARQRIGAGLLVVAVLAAIIGAGWYGFVEWPAQREQARVAATLNRDIDAATATLDALQLRRERLSDALAARSSDALPASVGAARAAVTATVRQHLDAAEAALIRAATFEQLASLSAATPAAQREASSDRLERQQQALASAASALSAGESALASLTDIAAMPERLQALRDQALDLAVEADVDARIIALHDDALAALGRADPAPALAARATLASMIETLSADWEVRVVSRPGVASGIIREPPNNRSASNYYLIVEALDANNEPQQLTIRSEEDGSVREVTRWGVRVDEATFERVRRDKSDDGIIQDALLGAKPRGYLDVRYTVATPGGFINRWESFR